MSTAPPGGGCRPRTATEQVWPERGRRNPAWSCWGAGKTRVRAWPERRDLADAELRLEIRPAAPASRESTRRQRELQSPAQPHGVSASRARPPRVTPPPRHPATPPPHGDRATRPDDVTAALTRVNGGAGAGWRPVGGESLALLQGERRFPNLGEPSCPPDAAKDASAGCKFPSRDRPHQGDQC